MTGGDRVERKVKCDRCRRRERDDNIFFGSAISRALLVCHFWCADTVPGIGGGGRVAAWFYQVKRDAGPTPDYLDARRSGTWAKIENLRHETRKKNNAETKRKTNRNY